MIVRRARWPAETARRAARRPLAGVPPPPPAPQRRARLRGITQAATIWRHRHPARPLADGTTCHITADGLISGVTPPEADLAGTEAYHLEAARPHRHHRAAGPRGPRDLRRHDARRTQPAGGRASRRPPERPRGPRTRPGRCTAPPPAAPAAGPGTARQGARTGPGPAGHAGPDQRARPAADHRDGPRDRHRPAQGPRAARLPRRPRRRRRHRGRDQRGAVARSSARPRRPGSATSRCARPASCSAPRPACTAPMWINLPPTGTASTPP